MIYLNQSNIKNWCENTNHYNPCEHKATHVILLCAHCKEARKITVCVKAYIKHLSYYQSSKHIRSSQNNCFRFCHQILVKLGELEQKMRS